MTGQSISSKVVCCKAQDIGFTGIANITAAYQYTHVDVRPNGKWYGDEVHGNSTVTDDFYKYFGGEDMKGIDVSVHNGNIDWNRVKSAGIDFAILRADYGRLASQKDERFEQNYSGAKAAGVPVGAYWYSYAMTPEEAELEAEVFLSVIKGNRSVWLCIDEPAAEVVRKIFKLCIDGYGTVQIARILTEQGIPTPTAYALSQGRDNGRHNAKTYH